MEVAVTGLPDAVTRESRWRLVCILRENRLGPGRGRLHLNLVPAARPKSGAMLSITVTVREQVAVEVLFLQSVAVMVQV